MATTITWVIEWMSSKLTDGPYQDVVITAGWRCNGVDGEYNATVYGSCTFLSPTDNFTPYDQLTEQQVLDWCWGNNVNKTDVEINVEQQIQNQINPPVVQLPLPWSA